MGKSLNGKELGKGISQRKDGRYQARFVNRFGKRETIYAKSLNEIRHRLRAEQYNDDKMLNVVDTDVTLDEWYDIWMDTCKKNCRNSTKETYAGHYRRIQKQLGGIKLTKLNLIMLQQVFNELRSDNERKNSKKILVDMLEKAIDSDLLIKNVAKQINCKIENKEQKERRVLTIQEEELSLKEAEKSFYYNLFVVGLETGLRIGELMALTWSDIDLKRKVLYVRHTLTYFRKDGKYSFEWHAPKTKNSRRRIPLTKRAYEALERQRVKKLEIEQKGQSAPEGYENLVFVTKNNNPTQQFIVAEGICACLGRIQKDYPEFESFSPHTLRHTFATRAIENGMKPTSLQKLMGHASIKTTMDLYCHVTDDTLYDEMQLMEKAV